MFMQLQKPKDLLTFLSVLGFLSFLGLLSDNNLSILDVLNTHACTLEVLFRRARQVH